MFDGEPLVVNVTLCRIPLVLFQVTVPPDVMVRVDGLKLLPPMTTVLAGVGVPPPPPGGFVMPPPPPPPPQASKAATTSVAPKDRKRIAGIKVSSEVWFVGVRYQTMRSVVLYREAGVGRA